MDQFTCVQRNGVGIVSTTHKDKHLEKGTFWGGFQRGAFARGGISIVGVVRTPLVIIHFAAVVQGLLVESYTNSEIFTGI